MTRLFPCQVNEIQRLEQRNSRISTHGVLGKWMLRRLFAIALSDKSVVLTFFSFLIVSLARIQTNLPPLTNERKLLDERKKHQAVLFSPGEFHTHPMVIPIQKNPDSNGRRAAGKD